MLQLYQRFSRSTDWTPLPRRLKISVVARGLVGMVAGHSLSGLLSDSLLILIPVGAFCYSTVALGLIWWLRKRHEYDGSDTGATKSRER